LVGSAGARTKEHKQNSPDLVKNGQHSSPEHKSSGSETFDNDETVTYQPFRRK